MNFEHVSEENRQKHRQSYLPGFEESTIFSPPYPDVVLNRKPIDEVQLTNAETTRILQRLSDKGLCGYEHVKAYLQDLYRRNYRPSTIRGNGTTIIFSLSLTLTTLALYQRSLRGFETCSCKPVPRGLPSSFVQLHTLHLLLKCARGTLAESTTLKRIIGNDFIAISLWLHF